MKENKTYLPYIPLLVSFLCCLVMIVCSEYYNREAIMNADAAEQILNSISNQSLTLIITVVVALLAGIVSVIVALVQSSRKYSQLLNQYEQLKNSFIGVGSDETSLARRIGNADDKSLTLQHDDILKSMAQQASSIADTNKTIKDELRNKELLKNSLTPEKVSLDQMLEKVNAMHSNWLEQNAKISVLEHEVNELRDKNSVLIEEKAEMRANYENRLTEIQNKLEIKTEELKTNYENQISELRNGFEEKTNQLRSKYGNHITQLNDKLNEYQNYIEQFNEEEEEEEEER